MKQDIYTTQKLYPVCLNLELRHNVFLKEITHMYFDGNYDLAIYSLLNKYLSHLYEIRISPYKKTETATYQPKTKQYRRWTIKMNPVLWSKLFEMRHFIGYSISGLIRILIEWEMQSYGYDIIPWIALPIIQQQNGTGNIQIHSPEPMLNNYFYKKQGFYMAREIIASFEDQFY